MANKQKLTPWFPLTTPPVRKGVYEVPSGRFRAFAYWNGKRFGYRTWAELSDGGAPEAAQDAFDMRHYETCLPALSEWRGLAEQPK